MTFKWKKQPDDIARVILKKDVSGIFSKAVVLSPNEKAVIIKNGVVQEIMDSGKIRVGGLLKPGNIAKDVEIAFMDTSPKDIDWAHGGMWTADNQEIGCGGLLRFKMQDPKRFFQMLFSYAETDRKGRRSLSVQDLYARLESETITRVLEPEVRGENVEDIYGNRDLQLRLENELEMQLKSTLSMWGLELLKFTSEWDLSGYAELVGAKGEFEKQEELKELDTLGAEGDSERGGRVDVAEARAGHAPISVEADFGREQALKETQAQIERERLEDEADLRAATAALKLKEEMQLSKARGTRANLEVEQDMADREHGRDMEYMKTVAEAGGGDVAKTISEGRELGKLSPAQIEALAKLREAEMRAKEDKVEFMKEVEDRERDDAYRRQELDASLMDAAKPMSSGGTVKKCPHCGATIPMQANFCGDCGSKI